MIIEAGDSVTGTPGRKTDVDFGAGQFGAKGGCDCVQDHWIIIDEEDLCRHGSLLSRCRFVVKPANHIMVFLETMLPLVINGMLALNDGMSPVTIQIVACGT